MSFREANGEVRCILVGPSFEKTSSLIFRQWMTKFNSNMSIRTVVPASKVSMPIPEVCNEFGFLCCVMVMNSENSGWA